MVWSDQSQFPFEVYDDNNNLIAVINQNGITIYGNQIGGQLNIINQAIPGLAIGIQLNQGTGAPLIAFGGRNSTGGKQYFQTFDDNNDNAYEEYAVGGNWRIHNNVDGWRIYNVATGFDGVGFDPTDETWKTIRSGNFESWTGLSYQNAWANLGGNWETGAYRMTPERWVEFKGVIIGGTKTDGTVLWNMPAAYRPTKDQICNITMVSSGAIVNCNLRVFASSGDVQCFGISGSTNGNMALNAMRYPLNT